MATLINGNQISNTTNGLVAVWAVSNDIQLPVHTTTARGTNIPSPVVGTMIFNSTKDKVEVYTINGGGTGIAGWTAVGAETSVGNDSIIRTNGPTVTQNCIIGPSANGDAKYTYGMSAESIGINTGIMVQIESGSSWVIVG